MASEKLNVDYPHAISAFESAMNNFLLKRTIYKILYRGKGLEFEAYRNYAPDDDASMIDWKASYRANKTLVRQYIEERDIKIMFIIDVGSNMVFGSTEKLKCEYAAEVVAALSHLISTSGDKIGFILPRDKSFYIMDPLGGSKRFNLFIDLISRTETYVKESTISGALDFLTKNLDKSLRGIFIISDFMNITDEFEKNLKYVSTQVETVCIMVRDPLERKLPKLNAEVVFEDPKTGRQITANPSVIRDKYRQYALHKEKRVKNMFNKTQADYLELLTNKDFPFFLAGFMRQRAEEKGVSIVTGGF